MTVKAIYAEHIIRGKSTARPARASKQYDTDTTCSAWLEQSEIYWISHTKSLILMFLY